MADSDVVTRFAPSPTGALHVGGARTALFNWAFARRQHGRFLLRIEDTDRARSSAPATDGILQDLRWLGLAWDNPGAEPRQSQRLDRYNAAVDQLIAAGRAYEDEGAIRFKMPGHDITVHDEVLGPVTVQAGEVEDFVIRKGDSGGKMPTYHLAVIVDDADMAVTHVIRGQEHLNNAPKHVALQQALDLPTPAYAHIPLIFNPDGSKMSKRDKAKAARQAAREAGLTAAPCPGGLEPIAPDAFAEFLDQKNDDLAIARAIARHLGLTLPEIDVSDFRGSGYLPDVLCTYLALLGWNPGGQVDEQQITREYLTEHFDLKRVGKSNAKFDRAKLARFNADAIQRLLIDDFARRVWALPVNASMLDHSPMFAGETDPRFAVFCAAYQPRSTTLRDPLIQGRFFFVDDSAITWDFDEKNVKKSMLKGEPNGAALLRGFRPMLDDLPEAGFGAAAHEAIRRFCDRRGLNMGKLAQPIRVAVSGGTVSPPIDATLDILGKRAALDRIDRCLAACPIEF